MILKHQGKNLKIIPEKFAKVENITEFLEDEDKRRLTEVERQNLEDALFIQEYEIYLRQIVALKDKEMYEKVKNSKPAYAVKIKMKGGKTNFVIRTTNNISLRCPKSLYLLCKEKRNHATQLSLFEL